MRTMTAFLKYCYLNNNNANKFEHNNLAVSAVDYNNHCNSLVFFENQTQSQNITHVYTNRAIANKTKQNKTKHNDAHRQQ